MILIQYGVDNEPHLDLDRRMGMKGRLAGKLSVPPRIIVSLIVTLAVGASLSLFALHDPIALFGASLVSGLSCLVLAFLALGVSGGLARRTCYLARQQVSTADGGVKKRGIGIQIGAPTASPKEPKLAVHFLGMVHMAIIERYLHLLTRQPTAI